MFTGIVEEKGKVREVALAGEWWRMRVAVRLVAADVTLGDSIAVNGCCLTVCAFDADTLTFDVLEETRRLTNFADLRDGLHVNLERSLRADARLGGHFVSGHIDGLGTVEVFEKRGADHYLRILTGANRGPVVPKGSIAIDGVSLTVAELDANGIAVWLIPTTLEVTNLGEKRAGDRVNLEFDLLGKYVQQCLGKGAR
ncbi:MAG: riboflavin synthase [Cephaloticoccus sp.]